MNDFDQQIDELTCRRVGNFAQYIFHVWTYRVQFGNKEYPIPEICSLFPDVPARSIQVVALCGPPRNRKKRKITLADLVRDWYWFALAKRWPNQISAFKAAMGGSKCAQAM